MALPELSRRVLVAVVGVPRVLGASLVGGPFFLLLVAAITLRGQWELTHLLLPGGGPPSVQAAVLATGTALLAYAWLWGGRHWAVVLLTGTLVILLLLLMRASLPHPGGAAGAAVLSWLYVAAPLAHLVWLRGAPGPAGTLAGGAWAVVALWGMVWGSDTAAYFAGRAWGRHRLLPEVSPKKSVEGTLAGIITAAGVGSLVPLLLPLPGWHMLTGAGIGIAIGIAAVLGDLIESRLKRGAGRKDSSSLLPGHGGVLDRFDSTILCAPLLYYMLILLQGATPV